MEPYPWHAGHKKRYTLPDCETTARNFCNSLLQYNRLFFGPPEPGRTAGTQVSWQRPSPHNRESFPGKCLLAPKFGQKLHAILKGRLTAPPDKQLCLLLHAPAPDRQWSDSPPLQKCWRTHHFYGRPDSKAAEYPILQTLRTGTQWYISFHNPLPVHSSDLA